MSPRKSSTSSARAGRPRPRYLGLEVAGEHLPSLSPRAWESLLADRLAAGPGPGPRFRVIRSDGRRAIVEVDHLAVPVARNAWSTTPGTASTVVLTPRRTWGTLVRAKRWLEASRSRLRR